MKEKTTLMSVPINFKKLVKIEAAKKGKTMTGFLNEIELKHDPLKEISNKYKKRFDFV